MMLESGGFAGVDLGTDVPDDPGAGFRQLVAEYPRIDVAWPGVPLGEPAPPWGSGRVGGARPEGGPAAAGAGGAG